MATNLFFCAFVFTAFVIQTLAQQPTTHKVQFTANNLPFEIVIDVTKPLSVLNVAEIFCREKAGELKITTLESLVLKCIVPVGEYVRDDLAKVYDPKSIQIGDLGQESKAWYENYLRTQQPSGAAQQQAVSPQQQSQQQQQQQQQQQAATPQQQAATPEQQQAAATADANELQINIVANEKKYTLVVDRRYFTVVSTAENFCINKAADLGITSDRDLITSCIPAVATVIRDEVAKTLNLSISNIPMGELSPAVLQVLTDLEKEARVPVVPEPAYQFTINVPIDDKVLVASFDSSKSSPMLVAESVCDSNELGINSIELFAKTCVPLVAQYIKNQVDLKIAPKTIALGDNSARVKEMLQSLATATP